MEHKFNNLSEDEILNLEPMQLEQQIKEISQVSNILGQMSQTIVGRKLMDIIYGYDLEQVGIDPTYTYNDEGFCGTFMIYINHEDMCMTSNGEDKVPRYSQKAKEMTYSELQQKIDDELSPISHLITEDISFNEQDLNKLKIKSNFYKLEKELPKNEAKSQINSSRYKL